MDGAPETDAQVCLKKIAEALTTAKADTADLEKIMRQFFGQPE